MTLTVGGRSDSNGIYVNERVIAHVENLSTQYPDATLKLTFDPVPKKDGGSFQPSMILFGKFKRDDKGKITDWGSAFKLSHLLEKVAGWHGTINTDGSIPDDALESLTGRPCVVLQYPTFKDGRKYMQNYQMVAALTEWDSGQKKEIPGSIWLRSRFFADVGRGYVQDYADEATSFPPAAHALTHDREF
jgi:hypothetical protein